MKLERIYTCRGKIPTNTTERITLFDGRFDTVYKVVKFEISAVDGTAAADAYGKLTTESLGTGARAWNWDDMREVAWASANQITTGIRELYSNIDPENLIVEDLYVTVEDNNDGDVNYMITLEKYTTSDSHGALAMVKNRAQG
jgi:hypothetical protein